MTTQKKKPKKKLNDVFYFIKMTMHNGTIRIMGRDTHGLDEVEGLTQFEMYDRLAYLMNFPDPQVAHVELLEITENGLTKEKPLDGPTAK